MNLVISSKLRTNGFKRRVNIALAVENMGRDAVSVEPFPGNFDHNAIFFAQNLTKGISLDWVGEFERHQRAGKWPGRWTDHLDLRDFCQACISAITQLDDAFLHRRHPSLLH